MVSSPASPHSAQGLEIVVVVVVVVVVVRPESPFFVLFVLLLLLLFLPPPAETLLAEPGLQELVEQVEGVGPLLAHLAVLAAGAGVALLAHAAAGAEDAAAVALHPAVQAAERRPARAEARDAG